MLNRIKIFLFGFGIVKHLRNQFIKIQSKKAQKHYVKIKKKIDQKSSLCRFGAYVVFDACFGASELVEIMLSNSNNWDVKIVIIPDVSRGTDHLIAQYKKTREFFVNKYSSEMIIDGYDIESGKFFDFTDKFDIIYYSNPYDGMVNKIHSIEYASKQNVLPIYISYGYDIGMVTTFQRLTNKPLNLLWKCYTDTTFSYEDYKKYQLFGGKNVVLAGYSKMDTLAKHPLKKNRRKRILISPHHTVAMDILPLSNFLLYHDLILELPEMFPNVDFVFRPHPLLFTTLVNYGFWTMQQVEEYLQAISEKGIEYSVGGDYLQLFAECDAIINDCGSFTVEWLFTGKPGCFVYSSRLKEEHLTTLMKKAIEEYEVAHSRNDIIQFIRRVVDDTSNNEYVMKDWVRECIAVNYPNVSEYIENDLRK